MIGPLLANNSAQARAGHGYARADFTIDYDTRTVTCPQGKSAATWTPSTQRSQAAIVATRRQRLRTLPRPRPVHQKPRRQISLLPRDLAEAQAAARAAETTTSFQADYARRAGVEGAMHQAASHGARRARYRGCPKPASTTSTWPARST